MPLEKLVQSKTYGWQKNPPGFAFVEMEDPRDAEDAVKALRGKELCGMRVTIQMAKAREEKRERDRENAARMESSRRSAGRDDRSSKSRGRRDDSRDRKRDRSRDKDRKSRDHDRDRDRDGKRRERSRSRGKKDKSRSRDRKKPRWTVRRVPIKAISQSVGQRGQEE